MFDTGSPGLEIPSIACGSACSNQRKFNTSASSTFVDLGTTIDGSFETCIGVTPVINNNCVLTVREAEDTVSVAGLTVQRVQMGLITNQTASFAPDPFDGILGKCLPSYY
jgi:hypothetical protein